MNGDIYITTSENCEVIKFACLTWWEILVNILDFVKNCKFIEKST